MNKVKLLVCISLLMSSSLTWSFGGGMSYQDGLFWSLDLNRNEQLTRQEAQRVYQFGREEVFKKYDQSGEGLISKFEFFHYLNRRSQQE